MIAAFNFQMAVKMLNAADDSLAFSHAGPGPQRNRISFFAGRDGFMRLMGVAPRGAPVNKRLELARNVRPVGRRNRYDDIRPGELIHQDIHIIHLNAFRGLMAASASPAVPEMIIIDAHCFYFISGA